MTIRNKILMVLFLLFAMTLIVGSYIMWETGTANDYLKNDVPKAITTLEKTSQLDEIAQLIRYDDEVLTQSARNYAYTSDVKWKDRYNEFAPKLDLRISQALEAGDAEDKQFFVGINLANVNLIGMEAQSFALVDEGNKDEARQVLDCAEYSKEKGIFKAGLDKYLAKRGAANDQAVALSTETLNDTNIRVQKMSRLSGIMTGIFITIILLFIGILYYMIIFLIFSPLNKLKDASEKITKGDLTQRLEIRSNDEIGQLSKTFNKMTSEIKESRENIEAKIEDRTHDLEKLNIFMTGRELKMIELKNRIKKIESINADKK